MSATFPFPTVVQNGLTTPRKGVSCLGPVPNQSSSSYQHSTLKDDREMGASSSTEQVSLEQREAESSAASTGALTVLQKAYSNLADPLTKTIPVTCLKECFKLSIDYQNCEPSLKPENFPGLLNNLVHSILDHFFLSEKDGGALDWISFLKGYTKCCGRMPASNSLNNLLKVFGTAILKSGATTGLQIDDADADCKINGHLLPADLLMLLWMCWAMSWSSRNQQLAKGEAKFGLPDINNLVLSAVSSCTDGSNIWDDNILGSDTQIPVGKLHVWVLKTVPNLPGCLVEFIHSRLSSYASQQDILESSSSSNNVGSHSIAESNNYLLTRGRAWSISLTLRSTMRDEILKTCFASSINEVEENLIYRSSIHGKGLNRFWSNAEGYNGPILVLISAISEDQSWSVAALTHQGFENKEAFYGTSGSLYAISPVFDHRTSSGKEKNFVYSHLHTPGYEAKPKPVGMAFGGSLGNERVFMDEDFSRLTMRHHACDKTYQSGSLFPNQGYLPTEAQVLEVEVWGLGGEKTKEAQNLFQKREQLFTEQRRKIDLKTFSNWEDSPEKMMMDMVSNPNAVRREER